MRVLLVEPDTVLAGLYREALEHAGHEVVVATTAQAAVHATDAKLPDVVVLELQLPAHNGVEFLHEFRSYPEWSDVCVIVNSSVPSGDVNVAMLQRYFKVAAYHYKPRTSLRTLVRSIQDVVALA